MALTPEGRVKAAIKKFLTGIGAWYCMPATGGYGASGVPDFLVCKPVFVTADMVGTIMGEFVAIEAKAAGQRKNTTPMQDMQIAGIHKAGGRAIVCDDVMQLEEFL
jgi:hypothetical protein